MFKGTKKNYNVHAARKDQRAEGAFNNEVKEHLSILQSSLDTWRRICPILAPNSVPKFEYEVPSTSCFS